MLNTLTLLLLYQLGGEVLVRVTGLPIPGPVIGMTLLLLTLLVRDQVSHDTRAHAGSFLQHMSLFSYLPASASWCICRAWPTNGLPITLALVISTFAGMAVTAWVILAMLPKGANHAPEGDA